MTTTITLDCGVEAVTHTGIGFEYLSINITSLYEAYGNTELKNPVVSFKDASDLFLELHSKRYENIGISIYQGIYGGVDFLYLEAKRKI